MNRNHYLMLGTVLLLVGIAIFKVDNVTLTEETTKFMAQATAPEGSGDGTTVLQPAVVPKKTFRIPPAVRFALISIGAVLMLHAIAMQKPGG